MIDPIPNCEKCGCELHWDTCWACGGAAYYHDCGEDTCCCAVVTADIPCEECGGRGEVRICAGCEGEVRS